MTFDRKAAFRENLQGFFRQEICFLADSHWQRAEWENAYGERFGMRIWLYRGAWHTVRDNKRDSTISEEHYKMLETLYNMVEAFQVKNEHPTKPAEYLDLLNLPEWKAIQEYALKIFHVVGPRI